MGLRDAEDVGDEQQGSIKVTATITCPTCGANTEAEIPEDACQIVWDCPACRTALRPKQGDCCVFCSYADRRCPTAPPT